MPIVFDTSVAIAFRDGAMHILDRASELADQAALSILTVVELEGGVAAASVDQAKRRAALDAMYEAMPILSFTPREAAAYREIVEHVGFSRRRVIDRMIAATALVAGARLATFNPRDFRDIRGLEVEDWS